MQRLTEVAILQLSNQEHDDLHKDALGWVNRNKVFYKDVTSVNLPPHPQRTDSAWVVSLAHELHCAVSGSCATVLGVEKKH